MPPSEPPREDFTAPSAAGPPPVPTATAAQFNFCPACGGAIDAYDRFCRHCGKRQGAAVARWYHHPLWIVILTVTVLGPFSLPLVWRSPKMDRRAKWLMSAGVVLFTVLLIYYTMRAVDAAMSHLAEVDGELGI